MEIEVLETAPVTIVEIMGRIDTTTSVDFENQIVDVLKTNGNDITLNCEGLEYISSSGLRALLVLAKTANSMRKNVTLSGTTPMVKKVITVSHFDAFFKMV